MCPDPLTRVGVQDSRYTVLGPLMGGKGSSAFLGCVQDDGGGQVRPVVMVFLPQDVVENTDLLSQISAETEVASNIDHVNVIGVFGVAKLDEGVARVVEFADAESLHTIYERLRELGRWVPPHIAAAIVANACMGVHYAHELGRAETGQPLLHGGIRPGTLLVSFQGMAKVTGYGASTLAEWIRKERGEEAFIRDPYTAPEQIFGGRNAASEHTDVYALGAVLFEALTGKPPFSDDAALADALIREDIPQETLVGVHPGLSEIVIKAMRRRAQDRYATAIEMRHALLDTGVPASEGEVRAFMEDLFPVDFPTRVARMTLLSSARKRREHSRPKMPAPAIPKAEPAPTPTPTPTSVFADSTPPQAVSAAPTAAAPPASSSASRPLAARPAPTYATTEPPIYVTSPPTRVEVRTPTGIIIALALMSGAAIALLVVLLTKSEPQTVVVSAPVQPVPVAPTPPPPPVEPTPPPPPVENDAKPATTSKSNDPPRPAKPAAPSTGTLHVSSEPGVSLFIDGKPVGEGKASEEVKAGTHKVKAVNKARGINIVRNVKVKGGEDKYLDIEIGMGALSLDAPPGSDVFVDGKRVGTTPLPSIPLVEGQHTVVVKKGKAEYKRSFPVRAGDDVSLWVEFRTTTE
jgi:serine/threonine protein kinase